MVGLVPLLVLVAIVLLATRRRAAPASAPAGGVSAAVPPAIEAFGYLGAVLVVVGAVSLVSRSWNDLGTAGRLAILGGTAAALTAAGLSIRDEQEPVLWRLRTVVLLAGSGAVAGCTVVAAVDGLDLRDGAAGVGVGLAVSVHAGLLWWRRDRPGQHLALFGGLVATVASALGWAGAGSGPVGIALLVLAAAWVVASHRGLLPPAPVGVVAGSILLLACGSVIADQWLHVGVLVGLLVAGTLAAAGIALEEFGLTGAGIVGTLLYLPRTISVFFGSAVGVPVGLLVSGLVLLALMAHLVRRRSTGPSGFTWVGRRPRPL